MYEVVTFYYKYKQFYFFVIILKTSSNKAQKLILKNLLCE